MDYYSSNDLLVVILGLYAGIILVFVGISLVLGLLSIIGHWKVYVKAGQPGWSSIIPFYGSYIMYKITWGNGWLFLVPLVLSFAGILFADGIISSILLILTVVVGCITNYKLATAFGKGIGFTVGLVLLNWLFMMILGFSDALYLGVPQDGMSYRQLNERVQKHNDGMSFENPDDKNGTSGF